MPATVARSGQMLPFRVLVRVARFVLGWCAMRLLVVVFVIGCGGREASVRWPKHRERQEDRLKDMELRIEHLEVEVQELRSHPAPPAAPQS
jgi:hypothetical protein